MWSTAQEADEVVRAAPNNVLAPDENTRAQTNSKSVLQHDKFTTHNSDDEDSDDEEPAKPSPKATAEMDSATQDLSRLDLKSSHSASRAPSSMASSVGGPLYNAYGPNGERAVREARCTPEMAGSSTASAQKPAPSTTAYSASKWPKTVSVLENCLVSSALVLTNTQAGKTKFTAANQFSTGQSEIRVTYNSDGSADEM